MLKSKNKLVGKLTTKNTLKGKLNSAQEKVYPSLIDLEITPSGEKQTFSHDGSYGYDNVSVNAIKLQNKQVTPTTEKQVITADSDYTGLNQVSVGAVTNEIDDNIISENIKEGIDILGVTGNYVGSGGPIITKGIVVNSVDAKGFVTDASIVGMTTIPSYYLHHACYINSSYKGWLANVGENLHLPNNITSIGNNAFGRCTGLALTELPDTINEIWDNAFQYCTNLALTKLPSNLYSLRVNAFQYCSNLALTELPSGLTYLASGVFYDCKNITIKELPEGITNLESNVFRNCTSITEMTCLGTISQISGQVFYGCTNFEKLVLPNIIAVPTLSGTNAFTSTKIAGGTGYIYVPDDLVESFKTATNWSTYADQIKGVSELV